MSAGMPPGCVLKFFEEQYVDKFINEGELHFSQLGYFIGLEDDEGAIADAFEGARIRYLSPTSPGVSVTINGKKLDFVKDETIRTTCTSAEVQNIGILSMTNLDLKEDFDQKNYDGQHDQYTLKRTVVNELNRLSDNKTRIPVIIDAQSFLKKLNSIVKEYNIRGKSISYFSENVSENISLKELNQDPTEIVFLKQDKYAYQREVRIAYLDSVPKQGKSIYIGDLSECTFKLNPKDGLDRFNLIW